MAPLKNIVGLRFGELTVVSRVESPEGCGTKWLCLCDCGNYHIAEGSNLKRGYVRSCGCTTQKRRVESRRKIAVPLETNVICPVCGKKFHLKPYALSRAKVHYCSRRCQDEARKEYMSGAGNHQFGLKGELNSTWNGGIQIKHGYRLVQSIGHPFAVGRSEYVLEHRLIAEKYLLNDENSVEIEGKRYLSPDFIVHHKNKNRLDNRVENLEIMTLSEHQALHNKETVGGRPRDSKGRFVSRENVGYYK